MTIVLEPKVTDGSRLSINCVVTVALPSDISCISFGDVKIYVKNRRLKVVGLADNDVIHVANAQGFTVYKGTEHEVNLYAAGIYIIRVKGKTLKFTVK